MFFDIGKYYYIPMFAGRKKKTKTVRMHMFLASGVNGVRSVCLFAIAALVFPEDS